METLATGPQASLLQVISLLLADNFILVRVQTTLMVMSPFSLGMAPLGPNNNNFTPHLTQKQLISAHPSRFPVILSPLAKRSGMNQDRLTKALFTSSLPMALPGLNKLKFLHPMDLPMINLVPPSPSSAIHSSSVHQAMTSSNHRIL